MGYSDRTCLTILKNGFMVIDEWCKWEKKAVIGESGSSNEGRRGR